MSDALTVAAYYVPYYHGGDYRFTATHGMGWNHWHLLEQATSRFPGHRLTTNAAWFNREETETSVMEAKIAHAADHGIDAFIFQWYQYDDGPFLNGALERGYFEARNREDIGYGLLWSNQDWLAAHPAPANEPPPVEIPGQVKPETFRAVTSLLCEHHFLQPGYLHVDGKPWFGIADVGNLLESFGSIADTREALQDFRAKAKQAGHKDVHICLYLWKPLNLPEGGVVAEPAAIAAALGADSVSSRSWMHHVAPRSFPTEDYAWVRQKYLAFVQQSMSTLPVPALPCVSLGWDATPHLHADAEFFPLGYPATPVLTGNTTEEISEALRNMLYLIDDRPDQPRLLCIDSWNDWTHGAALEPRSGDNTDLLQACKHLFRPESE